ncbi:monovalent cation/H(+) antiporter subunit G [Bailinhaonella thermotolerans]|uniref:Monovalent cation/H(+) antiporter subunit G n=1 Tax=Bailinhaonella thermotolerans TaxID=1070861 RepID=A0A3A4B0W1_9ACTN|nr:monovalent cation/H(+) antiporter subunit G [Bailinhaonella thermotolerans]RJL31667.1 monovalent cation/H(+) antiporter subunit G [Bailinhaonella thermotolerans]
MTGALDAAAGVCLVLGSLLSLIAGVGLLRFPDTLTRMHAAAKPQVLGLLLVLVGLGLRLRDPADICMLVLIAAFQLLTVPVAAHMAGRAAYRTRRIRRDLLISDDLAGTQPPQNKPGL